MAWWRSVTVALPDLRIYFPIEWNIRSCIKWKPPRMKNPGPCTVNSNILYIIFLKIIISNEIHLWSGRIHLYKSLCISADRDALYEETWPTGIMPGLARFCECMISSSGAWRPFRFRFLSTFFPSFFFLASERNEPTRLATKTYVPTCRLSLNLFY